MAKTAVIAGTATVAVGATKAVMGGGSSKQAAAQQDAAQQQQIDDLQAQQAQLAAQQQAAAQQAAAQQAAAQQAAAQPVAPPVAAGPTPGSMDDQMAQIQKLAQMKDQGLITDEEFQAKKKQILGI
jgi:hypothetical protein